MASIFPETRTPSTERRTVNYGKGVVFDYKIGDFVFQDGSPVMVSGLENLRIYIEKTLRTSRYRFPIYSHSYGCELEELIGRNPPLPRALLESEIKRVIRDALVYDDRIEDIDDFKIDHDGDSLTVTLRVKTVQGQVTEVSAVV